jgi:hydroxymethylglutaryl-CoA synthase
MFFFLIYKSKPLDELKNRRVCLFSYGSGSASSMYSLIVKENSNERFTLQQVLDVLGKRKESLEKNRIEIEPVLYDSYLKRRELIHKKPNRQTESTKDTLYPGTWYLKSIDSNYRRVYDRKCPSENFDSTQAKKVLSEQLSLLVNHIPQI